MFNLFGKSSNIIRMATAVGRPLYVVISVMCYLASLGTGITVSVNQMANGYAAGLSSALTIQIRPTDQVDPEEQKRKVIRILNDTRGLRGVTPLPRAKSMELLAPYLGTGNLLEDISVPQLIDVRLDTSTPPDVNQLLRRLRAEVPEVVLDDHSRWKSRLLSFTGVLQGLTLAALILILLSTVAIVMFATRSAMAANREVVEVLHLVGARDSFIAGEFQGHFLRLGITSGLVGTGAAACTLLLIGFFAGAGTVVGAESFLPGLSPDLAIYPFLLLIPILSALVAMITARMTALSVIGKVL